MNPRLIRARIRGILKNNVLASALGNTMNLNDIRVQIEDEDFVNIYIPLAPKRDCYFEATELRIPGRLLEDVGFMRIEDHGLKVGGVMLHNRKACAYTAGRILNAQAKGWYER